ncbi:MAG: CpaF family protein [Candidatus Caenarcaniphilales bacterium]|nr:CpaF family protein [Candidatus Caenarcaniphilales bacterium]
MSNPNIVGDRIQALKDQARATSGQVLKTPAFFQLRKELHNQLLNEVSPEDIGGQVNQYEIKQQISQIVNSVAVRQGIPLSPEQKALLINELTDEVLGFGPLEPLLRDDSITEVMVNGHQNVFVERNGKLIKLNELLFEDENHLLHVIKRIAIRIGRRVDFASPMVDARLPDGSRVNAVVAPVSLDGSALTVRKFPKKALLLEDMVSLGALTPKMAKFVSLCVLGKMNTLVAGGTGSGKTTLLNALSAFIPNHERVITIEDSAELRLQQDHVVRLETRPPNAEGQGEIVSRDLVKNSLRMRPNRIIVGECRSGEALDMLQAMNTGHEGSMTTLHANTTRDTLKRLETLVLMSGLELPLKTVREMIASTIHIVILQSRFSDGSRRVKQISEIVGMEGDMITSQDIFVFKQTGIDSNGKVVGQFLPTGVLPKSLSHLKNSGIEVPMDLFAPDAGAQPTPRRS